MIQRMRFFRKLAGENVRNGAFEVKGKARKDETLRKSLAGSPKTSDGSQDNSREVRKRQTGVETIRGKPAEVKPTEYHSREVRRSKTDGVIAFLPFVKVLRQFV